MGDDLSGFYDDGGFGDAFEDDKPAAPQGPKFTFGQTSDQTLDADGMSTLACFLV
jgi:hypothetical protein